jgi:hypothetical protein
MDHSSSASPGWRTPFVARCTATVERGVAVGRDDAAVAAGIGRSLADYPHAKEQVTLQKRGSDSRQRR